MKKYIIFVSVLIGVVYFLGWHLQPFEPKFFSFHDVTQAGRIKEFAFALKTLQIPPRLAPHFSFGMGFPIFNFYAPFSYWVGGILTLVGLPVVVATKISIFLILLTMFVSMYLFVSVLFSFEAGLIAATVYTSSTWIATEIFARGNIGELWFIALLPLSLYFLEKNSKSKSALVFVATILVLSFTITSHNVLSLIGTPLLFFYCFTIKSAKKNLLAVFLALFLSSYYFLPLIFESSLTYAKIQAEKTLFSDHFLCLTQLWSSPTWELGGSGIGCSDGMSFKLGKIQLVLGLLGFFTWILSFLFNNKQSPKEVGRYGVISLFGIMSLFMMFSISSFLWREFSFLLAAFQFPWRFNSFFLFFVSFFAGYLVYSFKNKVVNNIILTVSLLIILAMFISSLPYFRHPWRVSYNEYSLKYISDEYIYKKLVYAIPEYLPRNADFDKWMQYGKTNKSSENYAPFIGKDGSISIISNLPYKKQMVSLIDQKITVNTLYFPFWHITVDDKYRIPQSFDSLGRPILLVSKSSTITVEYRETFIEIVGNYITLLVIGGLFVFVLNNKIWKKMSSILQ